jgi:hypothetical protein
MIIAFIPEIKMFWFFGDLGGQTAVQKRDENST